MIYIDIADFKNNIPEYINQVIKNDVVVKVCTKKGNAVILSEEDYNGLSTTLKLSENLRTKSEISEGAATLIEDCISEEIIKW